MITEPLILGLLVPLSSCKGYGWMGGVVGHLPSGVVKVNKEPIIPKFGEHLIMVTVHISCKDIGDEAPRPGGRCS